MASWTGLFCLAAIGVLSISLVNADGPQVDAPVGLIRGKTATIEEVQAEEFIGIPYAKPPVGELRFAFPVPFGSVGELNATKYGARCQQPELAPQFKNPIPKSEDCLFLNVYRKAGTKQGDDKPVIVIVHGGGFSISSASDFTYYSAPLAVYGDVVTVSFNYRLGALGFADMKDLAPGNLGLYDQRLALEWVQDNIRAFGGNPDKVTLLGGSAGAMSVSIQINTPLNKEGRKLFHAAILDAGVAGPGIVVDADSSFNRIKMIAGKLGCKTEGTEMLECLRKADAGELAQFSYDVEGYSPVWTFQPTIDGKIIPRDAAEDIRDHAKDFAKVKMLIGTSKHEGSMFATYKLDFTGNAFPNLTTDDEFVDWCGKLAFGYKYPMNFKDDDLRKKVAEEYYQKNPTRFFDAAAFMSDGTFNCPTNAFVKSYSKTNNQVYVYRFERKMKQKSFIFDPDRIGVFHCSPFLHFTGSMLGYPRLMASGKTDPEDKAYFLDAMQMVANFARSDDTPTFRGVQWPDFSKGEGVMVFDEKPHVSPNLYSEERCHKVFPFFEPKA